MKQEERGKGRVRLRQMLVRELMCVLLVLVVVLMLPMGDLYAEEGESKVEVRVVSIYAKKGEGGMDPSLNALSGKLRKGFDGYHSFKKVGESSFEVKLGEGGKATLGNGKEFELRYLEESGKYVKVEAEIPGKVRTKLRVIRGSTFFQAGLGYEEGILVVAIELK